MCRLMWGEGRIIFSRNAPSPLLLISPLNLTFLSKGNVLSTYNLSRPIYLSPSIYLLSFQEFFNAKPKCLPMPHVLCLLFGRFFSSSSPTFSPGPLFPFICIFLGVSRLGVMEPDCLVPGRTFPANPRFVGRVQRQPARRHLPRTNLNPQSSFQSPEPSFQQLPL